MANPQTEVERRLDRIEQAIATMADWLVQAQTGFGARDAENIKKILWGKNGTETAPEDSTETTQ